MNVSVFRIEYEVEGKEEKWTAFIVSSKYRLAVQQLVSIIGKKVNVTSSGKESDVHSISPEVIDRAATALGYVKPKKTQSRKKVSKGQPLTDDGYAFHVKKLVK